MTGQPHYPLTTAARARLQDAVERAVLHRITTTDNDPHVRAIDALDAREELSSGIGYAYEWGFMDQADELVAAVKVARRYMTFLRACEAAQRA